MVTMSRTRNAPGAPIEPIVPWQDTREWIKRAAAAGELRVVHGANWESEIGAIAEMLDHSENSPAVLFDDIPGYPSGRRVLVNANGTRARQAITLNLPQGEANHDGLFRFWRAVLDGVQHIAPREVEDGPVLENVVEGDAIDLTAFPAPVWHPEDGGRYIGTASLNILKDPGSDWVNVGTYRNEIFGPATMGLYISPGKHGKLIREAWFDRGEPCPVVVVVGADPLLFLGAAASLPYAVNELAWAGGVRGKAIDVVRGRHTGILFPATAEIAIEGFMYPGELHQEGPYGEFTGYYASGEARTPVVHVKAIYHRNDPIILGCPQGKPPHEDNKALAYLRAAQIEAQLRGAGVPRITGAWCPPEAAERLMTVIAVDQAYPGHATQALVVGGQVGAAAYIAKIVVVVDPDIDIYSQADVMWAIMTRCDPARDITIINRAWSGPLDPATHPDHRQFNSRLLIDATIPWEWRDRFADPVVTAEMSRSNQERWGWILDPGGTDPRG